MANLLERFLSDDFFENLSDTVDDILDNTEETLQTALNIAEDVVDTIGDVTGAVGDFVEENDDAFEALIEIELPNFSGIQFPSFDAPADLLDWPSAIFQFVRDLTEVEVPNLTLPRLPVLTLSGLGLENETLDLNLDVDLNEVVSEVQETVREVLDENEDFVNDLADNVEDVVDEVVSVVEGFIEETPGDLLQAVDDVVDIVGDVTDGVQRVTEESSVTGIIGGIFDIVSDVAQGVENIIGIDTGVPEVVDSVGDITTELTASIEQEEIFTFEFLEDVFELSDKVGNFLDDFNNLANEAIRSLEDLELGVSLEVDRDLFVSVGDVAFEISNIISDIGGGVLLTENPFDFLDTNSDEPLIFSASVTASGLSTDSNLNDNTVIATASLTLEGDLFASNASVQSV